MFQSHSFHSAKSRAGATTVLLALFGIGLLAGCKVGPQEFLERGKKLAQKSEYSRAVLEFRNAARLQPKNAEPYYQAGLAYLAMGDYQSAYHSLIRATELEPRHAGAQLKLAELIGSSVASTRDTRTLKEAEQRVESALAIVPGNADALSALGLTEYLMGKHDEAAKHLEAALEKLPQQLSAARTLALIKMNQQDLAGAEQVLRQAIEASPRSPEAQLVMARFFRLNGRPIDAETAYRAALHIDPKHGPALFDLAQLQLATGHKEDAERTLASLSALPDKQYRPVHAIFLFEQGKKDEALKEFEAQAKADPNDREAFQRLTSAYLFSGRFPDAERSINEALKRNPKNADALIERSRLFVITARFAEAEKDLNQVLKVQPNLANAHYLLARVYQARGRPLQRRDQLGEALRLDSNLLSARIELTEMLLASGAASSAKQIIEEAPQGQAEFLPVLVMRNWALLGLHNRAELRQNLDRALARYPNSADLLLQDGLLRLELKDFAGSRKALTQVLLFRPGEIRAVDALARSYAIQKQPALARKTIQGYAAAQPNNAPLQNLLGQSLAADKNYSDARKAFTRALASDPTFGPARLSAAYLDIEERKFDSAKQALESLVRTPTFAVQGYFALAVADERAGNLSAAMAHYRKVLEADPENAPALNNLAYHLANDTNQLDEALQYAQKAKELTPGSTRADDTLGWALYRKGLYESAVTYLERATANDASAVSKYHLAMAYVRTGSQARGARVLAEALRMDNHLPEAAAAQAVLAAGAK